MQKKWKHWHYKNTLFLVLSIILFYSFAQHSTVKNTLFLVVSLGYVGAFFAGMFFVSVFTVLPSTIVLFSLAKLFNPIPLAIIAGTGAVFGDYIIFRFFRDKVFEELKPIFMANGGKTIRKLFRTPYFVWLLPFLGAVIVASPLPDELGISLLGLTRVKNWQFIILSFILNSVGIFLIILAGKAL